MENTYVYDIKKPNFLLDYIKHNLESNDSKPLDELFGLDKMCLQMVELLLKKEYLPKDVRLSHIATLYENGFNYQEIANLRGVSKMGVCQTLNRTRSKIEMSQLKYKHREKRKEIKLKIYDSEIYTKLTPENYEAYRLKLGHSNSYFELLNNQARARNRKVGGFIYEG